MTFIFITHCYHPTFSVLYGLWKKDGNYYISTDTKRYTPADTTNQYMLMYKQQPDKEHNDRETLRKPQLITSQDIRNKYVMYENLKWFFNNGLF